MLRRHQFPLPLTKGGEAYYLLHLEQFSCCIYRNSTQHEPLGGTRDLEMMSNTLMVCSLCSVTTNWLFYISTLTETYWTCCCTLRWCCTGFYSPSESTAKIFHCRKVQVCKSYQQTLVLLTAKVLILTTLCTIGSFNLQQCIIFH